MSIPIKVCQGLIILKICQNKNPQKNRFFCGLSTGIAYRDTSP
jgi:hypothetical protein